MDPTEKRLAQCQRVIGYYFADPTLLETALTHSSLRSPDRECNERLEFLGDSVLGLVITEELYHLLPDSAEGEMTRIKSAVVSRKSLYRASNQLGLPEFAEYARGVGKKDELPTSVVANLVESVIGAIYLDAGYYPAREFVLRHLGDEIEDVLNDRGAKNYKSLLQHEVQQSTGVTPHYRTLEEEGPDHDKIFVVASIIQGREWGRASGANKKEAEQEAARTALEAWSRRGRGRRRRERDELDDAPPARKSTKPKAEKKAEKKADKKPEKKAEKKPDKKAERRSETKRDDKKREKKAPKDKKPAKDDTPKDAPVAETTAERPGRKRRRRRASADASEPAERPARRSTADDDAPRVKAAVKAKRPARKRRGDAKKSAPPPAEAAPAESRPDALEPAPVEPAPAPEPAPEPAPVMELPSRAPAPKAAPDPAPSDFFAGILDDAAEEEPPAQSETSSLIGKPDRASLHVEARLKAPQHQLPDDEDGFAL